MTTSPWIRNLFSRKPRIVRMAPSRLRPGPGAKYAGRAIPFKEKSFVFKQRLPRAALGAQVFKERQCATVDSEAIDDSRAPPD
jgi:hypothetical protein